ncbi:transcriptional regulator GlxA family with amidase domain [Rhizobium azooxidifex]|uniref:Transcriptional regulator GlxA family with amidase domain n=1 Tax=Mycoplana azooxidifex TaxID=1636188 RepID=A0A7W6D722_9HYPH|nr:GlxA family transcriptional regulator [Mycoplana azooxidifex]MBB3975420.1 transcriptional regulator GlxA family with amidase domain [Mycoplana azooxidifex]
MLEPSSDTLELDILVLPETNLILVASVIEPLRAANRLSGQDLYRWRILSPDGAAIETRSRIPVPVDGPFRPEQETVPLFILSSYQWQDGATPALRRQLSRTARHRTMMVGIESGSWLLAQACLLDGHSVTIHWEDREDFAAAYPQVDVLTERYVIDGKRITSGGSLPTLDLMLEIIRRRQGYSLALEVSRIFIYEHERTGGLLQVPALGNMRVADQRVSQAVRLMEETVDAPVTLTRLARRVGISARHLQDLFQETMGVAPHQHYLALRLNAARRKVIETKLEFADIAAATGFNSSSAFSRSYRAHYHESPTETRRRLRTAGKG